MQYKSWTEAAKADPCTGRTSLLTVVVIVVLFDKNILALYSTKAIATLMEMELMNMAV